MQRIETIDDVLMFALESLDEEWSIADFEVSDRFDLKIKLEGDQWDGAINYKIAKFILQLQHDILRINNEITGERITLKSKKSELQNLIISVRVDKGCTEIIASMGELIKKVAPLVEKKHVAPMIVALAVVASTTYLGTEYLERSKEIAVLDNDLAKQKVFLDTVNKSLVTVEKQSEFMYQIVKHMDSNDKIIIHDAEMSQQEALSRFRPKNMDKETDNADTYYIDDRYRVTTVGIEKQELQLQIGSLKAFQASTKMLSENEKKKLYDILAAADISNTVPSVDLQVVIEMIDGRKSAAAIVGLGEKRPSAISYAQALNRSVAKKEEGLVQAKLFDD